MMPEKYARFILLFVVPNAAFAAIAVAVPPVTLIAVFNSMVLALAIGVCIAYSPVVLDILKESRRSIDRADLLALGIFCSWFSIVIRTAWSLAWRYAGQPDAWTDTHLTSYYLYLSVCAAIFHLIAPYALSNRVPHLKYVKLGAVIACAVMLAMLVSWFMRAG